MKEKMKERIVEEVTASGKVLACDVVEKLRGQLTAAEIQGLIFDLLLEGKIGINTKAYLSLPK